jgi:hypothetical protein
MSEREATDVFEIGVKVDVGSAGELSEGCLQMQIVKPRMG